MSRNTGQYSNLVMNNSVENKDPTCLYGLCKLKWIAGGKGGLGRVWPEPVDLIFLDNGLALIRDQIAAVKSLVWKKGGYGNFQSFGDGDKFKIRDNTTSGFNFCDGCAPQQNSLSGQAPRQVFLSDFGSRF